MPGNEFLNFHQNVDQNECLNRFGLSHSNLVDEEYCLVASHIDDNLRRRIKEGDYVDFNRLLPVENSTEEEGRLELIYKEGCAYWIPASNRTRSNEITSIQSVFGHLHT